MTFKFHDVEDYQLEQDRFAPHRKGSWRLIVLGVCFLFLAGAGYVTTHYDELIDQLGNAEARFKTVENWSDGQDYSKNTALDPDAVRRPKMTAKTTTQMGDGRNSNGPAY